MSNQNIYQREADFLQNAKEFMTRSDYSKEELQLEAKYLIENYEELVSQVKIITRISDRLQRKLDKTNTKLEQTNVQLNETIDALTEAKIGRKAATIVMIVAIALFVVSEAWIEPIIDSHFPNSEYPFVGLGLKLVVAILIKPGEDLTNRYMLRKARKKQIADAKAKRKTKKKV